MSRRFTERSDVNRRPKAVCEFNPVSCEWYFWRKPKYHERLDDGKIAMKKLVHVYYSGRVQGVGFRFIAKRIAEELGLYGWVSNLDDGRVEIYAEGDEGALNDFLTQINSNFSRYIQDKQVIWEPAASEFRNFSIKFY